MPTRAERATVLAVDDRQESRQRYERGLADDYEVVTADSSAGALDVLHGGVDVVLLQQNVSRRDSDDASFSIRAAGHDCHVAFITEQEPTEDVIEAGYDAFLVEPVTIDELRDTVERLLARSSYETQLDELYSLCVKRARVRADGLSIATTREAGVRRGDRTEEPADADDVQSCDVAEIEARIREIRSSVDETIATFQAADYRASFRNLATPE